jgi:hypothetical protein
MTGRKSKQSQRSARHARPRDRANRIRHRRLRLAQAAAGLEDLGVDLARLDLRQLAADYRRVGG